MRQVLQAIEAMEAEMQQDALCFLKSVEAESRTFAPDDIRDENGNAGIDVRIQIIPDDSGGAGFEFHSGQACYDTDHNGFWGAEFVQPDSSETTLIQQARYMVGLAISAASMGLA